jgi:broad specificity phosphatase PhoE
MAVTELWLVRHGESLANVAASAAETSGALTIEIDWRDADVPLSETGEQQAQALGRWLASDRSLSAIWCSPYLRARQTVHLAADVGGITVPVHVDERLRDRELGILDLLTSRGVEDRYPQEAARRRWLGKFAYRPPGGESWADVALRVRSVLAEFDGGPALVVAHDAVVLLFIYVCLGLSELDLLDFARSHTVANASITRLVRDRGVEPWRVEYFSATEHLEASGVPVTEHPGDPHVVPQH